jgi:hypothetical protein
MLTTLHEVWEALPAWLDEPSLWQSLDIDYHPPRVERLYRAWGPHRVYLHALHPCLPEQALFHPHPWPSAMRVLSGRYEMGVGYGRGDATPPVAARLIAGPGLEYEMTDPDAWHYVRPLDGVALSLMVTGPPWDRTAPRSEHPLHPLDDERIRQLLAQFRELRGR